MSYSPYLYLPSDNLSIMVILTRIYSTLIGDNGFSVFSARAEVPVSSDYDSIEISSDGLVASGIYQPLCTETLIVPSPVSTYYLLLEYAGALCEPVDIRQIFPMPEEFVSDEIALLYCEMNRKILLKEYLESDPFQ